MKIQIKLHSAMNSNPSCQHRSLPRQKRAPVSAEINCNEIQISSEINKQQLSSHDLALCHLVFACFDKTLVEIQKQG